MITKIYSNKLTTNNTRCPNAKNQKLPSFNGVAQIICKDVKTCPHFFKICQNFMIRLVFEQGECLSGKVGSTQKEIGFFKKILSGKLGSPEIEDKFSIRCSPEFDETLNKTASEFAKENGFGFNFERS